MLPGNRQSSQNSVSLLALALVSKLYIVFMSLFYVAQLLLIFDSSCSGRPWSGRNWLSVNPERRTAVQFLCLLDHAITIPFNLQLITLITLLYRRSTIITNCKLLLIYIADKILFDCIIRVHSNQSVHCLLFMPTRKRFVAEKLFYIAVEYLFGVV